MTRTTVLGDRRLGFNYMAHAETTPLPSHFGLSPMSLTSWTPISRNLNFSAEMSVRWHYTPGQVRQDLRIFPLAVLG